MHWKVTCYYNAHVQYVQGFHTFSVLQSQAHFIVYRNYKTYSRAKKPALFKMNHKSFLKHLNYLLYTLKSLLQSGLGVLQSTK